MNKLKILIVLWLVLLSDVTFSQDFAPIGAKWFYSEGFFSWEPIIEDYFEITSQKDTMINGISCRKLIKRHFIACNGRPDSEFVFSRNDSVFLYNRDFNDFQVFYDFNSEKGDSWQFRILEDEQFIDTINVFVDSTSLSNINGTDLKTFYVTYNIYNENSSYSYSSVLIEGIGDIQYLFNIVPLSARACDGNYSKGLRCYEDNILGLYSTGIADSCNQIRYWTNIKRQEKKDIKIFPNPVTDMLEVSGMDYNVVAEIYEIQGKLILTKDLNSSNILDLRQIDNGVYIIVFRKADEIQAIRRIIKYF
jgi:hypothetical protein